MGHTDHIVTDNRDKKYEDILRNTLMKRTGKAFQRNMGQAPDPTQQQPTESHEDLANRIFDNILQKQKQMRDTPKVQATPAEPTPPPSSTERTERVEPSLSETYGNILDDILWPDGDSGPQDAGHQIQDTIAENSPYKNLLRRTLERDSGSLLEPTMAQTGDALSRQYADQLDEILNMSPTAEAFQDEDTSLTSTLYHQRLDDILWPKDERGKPIPPDVDESKVRAAVADFLNALIQPEIYSLITVKRQVLDENFGHFWITQTLQQLQQELNEIETRFTVWFFLNHLSFLKPLINGEFMERHRMVIEHLMPQKKADKQFKRTTKANEQNLIFDRMSNNKFEDVRRILKNYYKGFSEEDAFHIFNFLRMKLPAFLSNQQPLLMDVLRAQSPDVGGNPFFCQFLHFCFFSEDFQNAFVEMQEDEQLHKKNFQQFLKTLAEQFGDPEDMFLPVLLNAIDLYHEKARFFDKQQRQILAQGLELMQQLVYYIPDASLDKECVSENIVALYEERTQAQYHTEAKTLEQLGQEIGDLSRQGGRNMHIRINHLNKIYERHQQQMSELYHKRRDTLTKWTAEQSPGGQKRSRKQFVQRKIKSAQQFLRRNAVKKLPTLTVPYKVYPAPYIDAQQKEAKDGYTWDNSFEEEIVDLAFDKARLVLKAINESKSTVQLNLKILFNAEPRQSEFLKMMAQLREQVTSAEHLHHHPGFLYVKETLDPYFQGLKLPELSEPVGMSYRQMAGYIVGYLGHTSHLRLLLNQQYKQVVYGFRELFQLAHALNLFALIQEQGQHSHFSVLYQQSLFSSWDLMVDYCLFVGEGKYDFIANPLSLQDFSWSPPITEFGLQSFDMTEPEGSATPSFGLLSMDAPTEALVPVEEDTGFSLLSLEDPDDPTSVTPNSPPKEIEDPSAFQFGRSRRARRPGGGGLNSSRPPSEAPSTEAKPPSNATPTPPSLPGGRRRLPVSPEKFNMYQPPQRPAAPVVPISDQDFGSIPLPGQLPAPPAKPSTPPGPSTPTPSSRPPAAAPPRRGTQPLELSSTQDIQRQRKPQGTAQNTPEDRKRWLEITPDHAENQKYNQVLDSILDDFDGPAPPSAPSPGAPPPPPPPGDSAESKAQDILNRNQLNPQDPTSSETMLPSNFRKRRKRF